MHSHTVCSKMQHAHLVKHDGAVHATLCCHAVTSNHQHTPATINTPWHLTSAQLNCSFPACAAPRPQPVTSSCCSPVNAVSRCRPDSVTAPSRSSRPFNLGTCAIQPTVASFTAMPETHSCCKPVRLCKQPQVAAAATTPLRQRSGSPGQLTARLRRSLASTQEGLSLW